MRERAASKSTARSARNAATAARLDPAARAFAAATSFALLSTLPLDLVHEIVSHLPAPSLCALDRSSHLFREATERAAKRVALVLCC